MGLYDPGDDLKPPEKPSAPQRNPAQAPQLKPSLFQLGAIVATPGALETMNRKGINPAQPSAR